MSEFPCVIRAASAADHAAIRAVHAAGFPTDAEARLVDALRAAGRLTVSLVAEVEGQIVGHVAFSPVTVVGDDQRDDARRDDESSDSASHGDQPRDGGPRDNASTGVGLAPVAVLEAHRRRGVAAALIGEGIAQCRAAGIDFIVVLGEPASYRRFGFEPASRFGLRDEYGGGDAFQVLQLSADSMPTGGELVKYAPEFGLFAEEGQ